MKSHATDYPVLLPPLEIRWGNPKIRFLGFAVPAVRRTQIASYFNLYFAHWKRSVNRKHFDADLDKCISKEQQDNTGLRTHIRWDLALALFAPSSRDLKRRVKEHHTSPHLHRGQKARRVLLVETQEMRTLGKSHERTEYGLI